MENTRDSNGRTLRPEGSTISDMSMESSSTFVASPSPPSPPSSIHQRPGYQRVASSQEQDISYHGAHNIDEDTGLRIQNMKGIMPGPSIEISYSSESTPALPGSAGFLLSPSLSRSGKKSYSPLGNTPEEETEEAFYPGGRARSESLYRPFTTDSETEDLQRARRSSRSTLSPYGPTGKVPPQYSSLSFPDCITQCEPGYWGLWSNLQLYSSFVHCPGLGFSLKLLSTSISLTTESDRRRTPGIHVYNKAAFPSSARRNIVNSCPYCICVFHTFLWYLAGAWDWEATLWRSYHA